MTYPRGPLKLRIPIILSMAGHRVYVLHRTDFRKCANKKPIRATPDPISIPRVYFTESSPPHRALDETSYYDQD